MWRPSLWWEMRLETCSFSYSVSSLLDLQSCSAGLGCHHKYVPLWDLTFHTLKLLTSLLYCCHINSSKDWQTIQLITWYHVNTSVMPLEQMNRKHDKLALFPPLWIELAMQTFLCIIYNFHVSTLYLLFIPTSFGRTWGVSEYISHQHMNLPFKVMHSLDLISLTLMSPGRCTSAHMHAHLRDVWVFVRRRWADLNMLAARRHPHTDKEQDDVPRGPASSVGLSYWQLRVTLRRHWAVTAGTGCSCWGRRDSDTELL